MFRNEPIRFRYTTAGNILKFSREEQLAKLSEICLENLFNLNKALLYCHNNGIGAFRILSPIFPRYTHPEVAYHLEDLPEADQIEKQLKLVCRAGKKYQIRLSFHPDQFIVINSPREEVVMNSIRELEYQGYLAENLGAEVINIHGGGAYGDKEESLGRFIKNFPLLSERVQSLLSLENDDNSYTVKDLLPVCRELNIPLIYDVHHHRCNPDGLSIENATDLAIDSWNRIGKEPYFHISSPRNNWGPGSPKPHADYVDVNDFPDYWKGLTATIDVEAKAKELAVLKLKKELGL